MAFNNDDDIDKHRLRFGDVADEPMRMLPPIEGYQDRPLVSLEEAVKPLVKHIPDLEAKASEVKESCQNLSNLTLTHDEIASIRLYTMEWKKKKPSLYTLLNERLRSANRSTLIDWFLYLRLFINALAKIPSRPRLLFRGVKLNLSADYQMGEVVTWWAFSSCTDSMEVLESAAFCGKTGPRTIFQIDCYSGKDVRQYSKYPTESEVLLIAARQFRVTSKTDHGDGLSIVQLQETEPNCSLIFIPDLSPSPYLSEGSTSDTTNYSSGRNPNILAKIKQVQNHGNAVIEGEPIGEEDMLDLVQVIVIDKKYPKLQIYNSELTTDSISVLGRAIGKSTDLVEVDLSNNRLSSNDVSCLITDLLAQEPQTVMSYICWVFPRVTVRKNSCHHNIV